jgi:hypothetical protein
MQETICLSLFPLGLWIGFRVGTGSGRYRLMLRHTKKEFAVLSCASRSEKFVKGPEGTRHGNGHARAERAREDAQAFAVSWKLFRTTNATIDSCGFETYSFRCEWCAISFAGVIDPSDDELPVSILEPAGNTGTHPHTETEKDQGLCTLPIGAGKDQA